MNVSKDVAKFFNGEPPGERTNAIRWLQKKVMCAARQLPKDFSTLDEWEAFRSKIRQELPGAIGIPRFPPLQTSVLRARVQVGENACCERVDVYVDEDYAIPCFVFTPLKKGGKHFPGLVWNPGWPQDKWERSYQEYALRMVSQGLIVLILDHAPFGETTPFAPPDKRQTGMTQIMGMGNLLGISQLALRAAETMRVGEYLRSRDDINPDRVAVAGLCQGGQDTWLSAALDENFCAAAPICSATTYLVHSAEMASYFCHADASPYPFGILRICDIDHLHAAIAPRPLLVRANLPDQWWPVSGFNDVERLTRQVYRLYGAEEKLDFRAEVHEHNLSGPFADALESFLRKFLL